LYPIVGDIPGVKEELGSDPYDPNGNQVADVVVDKPTVSRKHLSIYREGGHAVLEVIGQNGIELEGEIFRGRLSVTSLLRFELWGDWFRLEGLSLHEEEKPTTYINS